MNEEDETTYEDPDLMEMLHEVAQPDRTVDYAMHMINLITQHPEMIPYPVQGAVWDYIKRFFNEDIT